MQNNFHFVSEQSLQEIVNQVFGMVLDISNGWGYTKEEATHIKQTQTPLEQLEHTLASMRTHLEMSITQPKENKYGAINLSELDRTTIENNSNSYHKVNYEVSAMLESLYNNFIDEYKEFYGKDDFDIAGYFERRKMATIKRTITYWFKISN